MGDVKKKYLVCVDSDGCAMDTMNEKHITCFGPKLIELYGLNEIYEEVQNRWNHVNLYSRTRGINRFLALIMVLRRLQADGLYHGEISQLEEWGEKAASLSNESLAAAWQEQQAECLKLALVWSEAVNQAIKTLETGHEAFHGVEAALSLASQTADIVVVSSANQEALLNEWESFLKAGYVSRIMSQNDGSKAACMKKLLEEGYHPEDTLMVGDAPGDLKAAKVNHIFFYPILAGKEENCWHNFIEQGLKKLINQTFTKEYQKDLVQSFYQSLGVAQ